MSVLDGFRGKRWQRYGQGFRQRSKYRKCVEWKREKMTRYRAENCFCRSDLHRRQRDKKWPNPYWKENKKWNRLNNLL